MSYKLIGYFENWAQYRTGGTGKGKFLPENIDPSLFTHVNYAFAFFGYDTQTKKVTGDYKVYPVEWNDQSILYPAIQKLKQQVPALKTSLSIGGWSFNDPNDPMGHGQKTYKLFSTMVSDPAKRKEFIDSAISYAQTYQFDGIDLDWEYPGDQDRGGDPKDFDNFTLLLKEFQDKKSGLLLTMTPAAVAKGKPTFDAYCKWLATCAKHLDWFNVMCYDYHGAFDKVTGANAPLPHDSVPSGAWCVRNTVEGYLKEGVPANKIVLGMPTYGRTFKGVKGKGFNQPFQGAGDAGTSTGTPGFLAYYEIQDKIQSGELTRNWDDVTKTPYADNQQGDLVSYDDEESLDLKTEYLLQKGLAGAMVWAIAEDQFQNGAYPLVKKIKQRLQAPVKA